MICFVGLVGWKHVPMFCDDDDDDNVAVKSNMYIYLTLYVHTTQQKGTMHLTMNGDGDFRMDCIF